MGNTSEARRSVDGTTTPHEQAQRRRECWNQIIRGLGEVGNGLRQIALALAKYYAGELTIQ